MTLNLISDPWIPVRLKSGGRRTVAPWQMADPDIAFPDWPRPDLNIACLELLIGLVFMADPPAHEEDWEDRQAPDPDRLKARLDPFAPAFNLLGDGPRFLQEFEVLESAPNSPDMLFIDSAGENAAKKNADLMVWRDRYGALALPLAAMALYTFQSFAPSGGAGNRTSMRGGGPLVTLVGPGQGLWPLIWANVPDGTAAEPSNLPWMRPTRVSNKAQEVYPEQSHAIEAFLGMPRRLRLVG
ncbi:type I-E CRISPR-associated protein Cse1/CasA [uncultured Aliiroseovarius sp.]|uniref:type I-E CRISPR-associated protein Cse1/CasA n=1 Tax=uncultured Aliiroseovarius sp. TaxID=1658783 RepID=UPI0025976FDB|nr:type I-E CRISPR-associated protein Cse1/CasA [uncultured Aliiroseovarius sp.]